MHIQAAPTSLCLQQARGVGWGGERETPSNQPSLPNTGIVLATTFISLSVCFLWAFLITEERKAEWTGKSMVDNTHTPAH